MHSLLLSPRACSAAAACCRGQVRGRGGENAVWVRARRNEKRNRPRRGHVGAPAHEQRFFFAVGLHWRGRFVSHLGATEPVIHTATPAMRVCARRHPSFHSHALSQHTTKPTKKQAARPALPPRAAARARLAPLRAVEGETPGADLEVSGSVCVEILCVSSTHILAVRCAARASTSRARCT